jgi:amino acid adenylation domain-containing protein
MYVSDAELFSLSPQQQQLVRLRPQDSAGLFLVSRCRTRLSATELQQRWSQLAASHEILRTRLVRHQQGWAQQILPQTESAVMVQDCLALSPEQAQSELQHYVQKWQQQLLWADTVQPVRLTLFLLPTSEAELVVVLPAYLGDAETLRLVMAALNDSNLAESEVQYADISEWFLQQATTADAGAQFFSQQLQTTACTEPLAAWQNMTGHQGYLVQDLSGSAQDTGLLIQLARQLAVAPADITVALFVAVLAEAAQTDSLLLWCQVPLRQHQQLQQALGLFESFLPVVLNYQRQDSAEQWIRQVRQQLATVSQLQGCYELWQQPDVLPVVIRQTEPYNGVQGRTRPAAVALVTGPDGQVQLELNLSCFAAETARWLTWRFTQLYTAVLENPAVSLTVACKLSEQESHWLLQTVGCHPASAETQNIVSRVMELARLKPDAIALECAAEQISYQTFALRILQTAAWLAAHGVQAGDKVAVYADIQPALLYNWFGIMALGACYLTLEPGQDQQRRDYMLVDAAVRHLVVIGQPAAHSSSAEILHYQPDEVALYQPHPALSPVELQQSAYCIYTSGSTGRPKGVLVSHLALATYSRAARNLLPETPVCCGFLASLSADLAYTCLYGAFAGGHSVRLLATELKLEPALLAAELIARPVDYLKVVPSHFSVLQSSISGTQWLPRRGIIFGGEPLTGELVHQLFRLNPALEVFNHYGPTETTVGAVAGQIKPMDSYPVNLPIGRALPGYHLAVLDAQLQPVPFGQAGQLYIGGDGVAQGYLNQPELTAEKFTELTFHGQNRRYYASGDLVRFDGQGALIFQGRLDNQVKIRGFRIEPEEIQRQLDSQPGISSCCVVVCGEQLSQQLVGFFTSAAPLDVAELKAGLCRVLPEIMIPARLIRLTELPRNASGKIDRVALIRLAEQPAEAVGPAVATSVTAQLQQIWQQLLKKNHLNPTDNYFDMGANSLLVIKARQQINSQFGISLILTDFFKHTTIASLAAHITQLLPAQGSLELVSQIWRQALNKPQLQPSDNFFDMGANSLLVIKIRQTLNQQLGIELKLTDFFKYTTISALAGFIDQQKTSPAEPAEASTDQLAIAHKRQQGRTAQQRRKSARESLS